MCQPFSFKAVVTAPRSLSGVAGDRGARGCAASCSVQLRGPPADCRIPGATVRVGFGSDSSVLLAQYGMYV